MEGSRGLGDFGCLVDESFQDLWMTVTLVDSGVPAKEVEILPTFDVPNMHSLASL